MENTVKIKREQDPQLHTHNYNSMENTVKIKHIQSAKGKLENYNSMENTVKIIYWLYPSMIIEDLEKYRDLMIENKLRKLPSQTFSIRIFSHVLNEFNYNIVEYNVM